MFTGHFGGYFLRELAKIWFERADGNLLKAGAFCCAFEATIVLVANVPFRDPFQTKVVADNLFNLGMFGYRRGLIQEQMNAQAGGWITLDGFSGLQ